MKLEKRIEIDNLIYEIYFKKLNNQSHCKIIIYDKDTNIPKEEVKTIAKNKDDSFYLALFKIDRKYHTKLLYLYTYIKKC